MVGRDPEEGSSITVVPTSIIPVRLVFADGKVLDPSIDISDHYTPIAGILRSPLFSPAEFQAGNSKLGVTQYIDAFQRANFWNIVSTKSPNYHVLLAPKVLASQTILVPASMGSASIDPATNVLSGVVNQPFLDKQMQALFKPLRIDPESLAIFVYHNAGFGFGSTQIAGGYHNAVQMAAGAEGGPATQTYVVTTYDDLALAGPFNADVVTLSHEIAEWMDDPFVDNLVPCTGLLEVGDPADPFVFETPLNGQTYHLQDLVFLSYFARSSPSTAVNGWYSFRNNFPSPLVVCPVLLPNVTFLDVPGADATFPKGINNAGQIVGNYFNADGSIHGFLLNKGTYSVIDYPGANGTALSKINDHGVAVGTYFDASSNVYGFTWLNGKLTNVNYPGFAGSTVANGINNRGDIVGDYFDANGVSHGFLMSQGHFVTIDAPYASNTRIYGINDRGEITGLYYDDPNHGRSFVADAQRRFSKINLPNESGVTEATTINAHGQVAGFYQTPGQVFGFAVAGNATLVFTTNFNAFITSVFGENDAGTIVGANDVHGFMAPLGNLRE